MMEWLKKNNNKNFHSHLVSKTMILTKISKKSKKNIKSFNKKDFFGSKIKASN